MSGSVVLQATVRVPRSLAAYRRTKVQLADHADWPAGWATPGPDPGPMGIVQVVTAYKRAAVVTWHEDGFDLVALFDEADELWIVLKTHLAAEVRAAAKFQGTGELVASGYIDSYVGAARAEAKANGTSSMRLLSGKIARAVAERLRVAAEPLAARLVRTARKQVAERRVVSAARVEASVDREIRAARKVFRARKEARAISGPKEGLRKAKELHAKKPFRAADSMALKELFNKALERPKDRAWETFALEVARGGGGAACTAIVVLANWGNRKATKLILERTSGPGPYKKGPLFMMEDACALLTKLGDPSAVPRLKEMLAALDPKKNAYSVPALKKCIRSLERSG